MCRTLALLHIQDEGKEVNDSTLYQAKKEIWDRYDLKTKKMWVICALLYSHIHIISLSLSLSKYICV